ncbi:hypothetical protein [Lichenibacterium ramalinae]|nr:hypothetical protein [Lichenibacterium ramalinae]
MPVTRTILLLLCMLCLAACAGETEGSREGTVAFVHRQLERHGL